MLQDADIDFLYYSGSMSRAEKHQAVRDFTDKKNIRILVSAWLTRHEPRISS